MYDDDWLTMPMDLHILGALNLVYETAVDTSLIELFNFLKGLILGNGIPINILCKIPRNKSSE